MNCASRLIAAAGLTFAMASALYADDAVTPKAKAASYRSGRRCRYIRGFKICATALIIKLGFPS